MTDKFVRDQKTGAAVNVDRAALALYKANKQLRQVVQDLVKRMEDLEKVVKDLERRIKDG